MVYLNLAIHITLKNIFEYALSFSDIIILFEIFKEIYNHYRSFFTFIIKTFAAEFIIRHFIILKPSQLSTNFLLKHKIITQKIILKSL